MAIFIGAGIILEYLDKYVIIQEVRAEKNGLFNLPAGKLDVGEDVIGCIEREAEEETGVVTHPDCFVGLYQTILGSGDNIVFFIFAAKLTGFPMLKSEEHKVIKLLAMDEIENYDKAELMRAPTVLKSITDYRNGQRFPLSILQSFRMDTLPSITVADKDPNFRTYSQH